MRPMDDHPEDIDDSSDSDDDRSSTTSFGLQPVDDIFVMIPPTFIQLQRLLDFFNDFFMWIMLIVEPLIRWAIQLVLMLWDPSGTAEPFHSPSASDQTQDQNQITGLPDQRNEVPTGPITKVIDQNCVDDMDYDGDSNSSRIQDNTIDQTTASANCCPVGQNNDSFQDNISESRDMSEEDDFDDEFQSLQVNDEIRNDLDNLIIDESPLEEAQDMDNLNLIDANEDQMIINLALLDDYSDIDSGVGSSIGENDSNSDIHEDPMEIGYDTDGEIELIIDENGSSSDIHEDATGSGYDGDDEIELISDDDGSNNSDINEDPTGSDYDADNELDSSHASNDSTANDDESDQDAAIPNIAQQEPQMQHNIVVNDNSSAQANDPTDGLAAPSDANPDRSLVVDERKDNHPVIHGASEEYSS